jgi:ATP-binding cassette subfamily B protein RaxB
MSFIQDIHYGFGKRLPVILQTESSECALACMAMVLRYHGHAADLAELRRRFPVSLKGATLANLSRLAALMGATSRSLKLDLEELGQLQLPAILHWDLNHFVVLKSVSRQGIHIHDPAFGALKLRWTEASAHFTGIAFELAPTLAFRRQAAKPPIAIRMLMGRVVGLKRGLAQLLGLAIVLEAIALAMPIFTQIITDEAVLGGNRDLLNLVALGLVALGITNAVVSAVRSWIGMYISTHFNVQWMSNVMGRLLRLPVDYFERRHVGDIVSRFGAVKTIEHGITSTTIDAFLDGLLATGTLVMMVVYSPTLTLVTVAAVFLYGLLRWLRYDAERSAAVGTIAKQAKEQSYFLETIRGVRSIKMSNRVNERRTAWLNLNVEAVNASLVMQRLALMYGTGRSIIGTGERALVLWLGAAAVIEHRLSLGMLFAFISYKEQFSSRFNDLIGRYVDFRMLNISVERLADIVMTAPEEPETAQYREVPEDLTLTFDNVSFQYASDDRYIIKNASMAILPGECVALVGPSGMGKTTCLKLILGMLSPQKGKICLGDVSIEQIGLYNFRSVVAAVMQDDQLFAGSIYDNIAFHDGRPDFEWAQECARVACIHDEITAMPMGYHTLLGDMGSVLSSGQKQRVLLARALYRKPKILVLDEATSHLDLENEKKIAVTIAKLNITRLIIAHRPQTIAAADRVLSLADATFTEIRNPSTVQREALATA